MNDNKPEMEQEYSFSYTDCDGKVYQTTIKTPDCTWLEALDDFVKFLESVFKYEIQSKIRVEQPFWMKLDNLDAESLAYLECHGWQGQYFSRDEEEIEDELTSEYGWGE
jgi:hypothetical protein